MKPCNFYKLKTLEEKTMWTYSDEILSLFTTMEHNNFNHNSFKEKGKVKLLVKLNHDNDYKYSVTYYSVEYNGNPFGVLLQHGRYGDSCFLSVTNKEIFKEAKEYIESFIENNEEYKCVDFQPENETLKMLDGCDGFIPIKTEDGYELVTKKHHVAHVDPEEGYFNLFDKKKIAKLRQEKLMPLYRQYDFVNTKEKLFNNEEICKTWGEIISSGIVSENDIQNIQICNEDRFYFLHETLPPIRSKRFVTFTVKDVKYEIRQDVSEAWNVDEFNIEKVDVSQCQLDN